MLDGEDVPGNDVPGDAGFVPKPIAPVPAPLAPPLISDSVEGTGGPVGVNGVLVFLEPVEPAAPAAPPAPGGDARTGYAPAGCSAAYLPPGEAAIAGPEAIRAAKAEATINFLMLSPLSCCFDGKHALGLAVPGSMFMHHACISMVPHKSRFAPLPAERMLAPTSGNHLRQACVTRADARRSSCIVPSKNSASR